MPLFVDEYVMMCCGNSDCEGEIPLEPANQFGDMVTCPECGWRWVVTKDQHGLLLSYPEE